MLSLNLVRLGCLVTEPHGSTSNLFARLGFQEHTATPSLLCGLWVCNLGPSACKASALLTQSPPVLQLHV